MDGKIGWKNFHCLLSKEVNFDFEKSNINRLNLWQKELQNFLTLFLLHGSDEFIKS